MTRQLSS